ncbi:MAG: archease [Proteobacteria bacterium]|nr:archease [Pseudomonadota bacterium]
MPDYEFLDHTADLGIRLTAPDLPGLYAKSALVLADLLSGPCRGPGDRNRRVSVEGEDPADLLVNWLREILFLFWSEGLLVCQVRIQEVSGTFLTAEILGETFRPDTHPVGEEIKAVTWHQARVARENNGWTAQVIFDV